MDFKKKRVLIVEDEMIIAEDIRDSLENHGYKVIDIFSSGEETLQRVDDLKPDIILMDIMLADELNGIETADKIHKNYNIPIVFVTALRNKSEIQERFQDKFSYVSKPYKESELFTAIEVNFYRQKMEALVKNEKQKLDVLIQNIPMGIVLLTDNGKILNCNEIALDIFAQPKEDLINEFFSFPFEVNVSTEIVLEGKEDNNSKTLEITTIQSPLNDDNGYLVFVSDKSELYLQKQTVENNQHKINNILRHLEIMHARIIYNDRLTFEDANSEFIKQIGLNSFRQLFDIEVSDIFHNVLDVKNLLKKIDQNSTETKMNVDFQRLNHDIFSVILFVEYVKKSDHTVIELFARPVI